MSSKSRYSGKLLAAALCLVAQSALADGASVDLTGVEIDGTKPYEWKEPLNQGTDALLRFTRAITGKPTLPETDKLLTGVTEMAFEDEGLMFTRVDNARLLIPKVSDDGKLLSEEWEAAKQNADKQFGPSGRKFLDSIHKIKESREGHIEIVRREKGELQVNLGERKLHRAFDLKGIRFNDISFDLGHIKTHPALVNIEGVTVIINAPGFTFPVSVKQFCKWKDKKGNMDVTVGVKNPVPGPIRSFLLMPKVVHFNFVMNKKDAPH